MENLTALEVLSVAWIGISVVGLIVVLLILMGVTESGDYSLPTTSSTLKPPPKFKIGDRVEVNYLGCEYNYWDGKVVGWDSERDAFEVRFTADFKVWFNGFDLKRYGYESVINKNESAEEMKRND